MMFRRTETLITDNKPKVDYTQNTSQSPDRKSRATDEKRRNTNQDLDQDSDEKIKVVDMPLPPRKTTDFNGNILFVRQKRKNDLPALMNDQVHVKRVSRGSNRLPHNEIVQSYETQETSRTARDRDSVRNNRQIEKISSVIVEDEELMKQRDVELLASYKVEKAKPSLVIYELSALHEKVKDGSYQMTTDSELTSTVLKPRQGSRSPK